MYGYCYFVVKDARYGEVKCFVKVILGLKGLVFEFRFLGRRIFDYSFDWGGINRIKEFMLNFILFYKIL